MRESRVSDDGYSKRPLLSELASVVGGWFRKAFHTGSDKDSKTLVYLSRSSEALDFLRIFCNTCCFLSIESEYCGYKLVCRKKERYDIYSHLGGTASPEAKAYITRRVLESNGRPPQISENTDF